MLDGSWFDQYCGERHVFPTHNPASVMDEGIYQIAIWLRQAAIWQLHVVIECSHHQFRFLRHTTECSKTKGNLDTNLHFYDESREMTSSNRHLASSLRIIQCALLTEFDTTEESAEIFSTSEENKWLATSKLDLYPSFRSVITGLLWDVHEIKSLMFKANAIVKIVVSYALGSLEQFPWECSIFGALFWESNKTQRTKHGADPDGGDAWMDDVARRRDARCFLSNVRSSSEN